MAAPDPALERRPLVASIAVTSTLGALGILWGLSAGSQMILLDGAYALIGVAVTWMLLGASRLAATEPGGHYPFGREGITPIVIGVQGFILLAALAYASVEAVNTVVAGGSETEAGWAALYGAVTAAAAAVFWQWLRGQAPGSDLVAAETTAWRISALGSIGMVVGFTAMAVVERWGWHRAAGYIDPAMVLVSCAVFAPAPLAMVRDTILELLEGEPDASIAAPVATAVAAVCARHGLASHVTRMSKLGPKLYIEVEAAGPGDMTIREQHAARSELSASLDSLPYDVWLNFEVAPDTTGL